MGGGDDRVLSRIGRMADGWLVSPGLRGNLEGAREHIVKIHAAAREAGRDPAEIDIIFRTHEYSLGASRMARLPFTGNADDIAADIRQYQALGVSQLIVDFARTSRTLDELYGHMEALAMQVWPRV